MIDALKCAFEILIVGVLPLPWFSMLCSHGRSDSRCRTQRALFQVIQSQPELQREASAADAAVAPPASDTAQ
jgi:hypothetical protein